MGYSWLAVAIAGSANVFTATVPAASEQRSSIRAPAACGVDELIQSVIPVYADKLPVTEAICPRRWTVVVTVMVDSTAPCLRDDVDVDTVDALSAVHATSHNVMVAVAAAESVTVALLLVNVPFTPEPVESKTRTGSPDFLTRIEPPAASPFAAAELNSWIGVAVEVPAFALLPPMGST